MAETLPGFDAEPGEIEEDEPQSGLGRGLAAIIPTLAPDLDEPAPTRRRRRRKGGGVAALLGAPADDPPPVDPADVGAGGASEAAPSDPRDTGATTDPTAADDEATFGIVAAAPSAAAADATTTDGAPPPVPAVPPEPSAGLDSPAPAEAEPEHQPAPSAVRKLRDDLVGALLDGLANTMALDVCAYLHAGTGEEPQLFLQAPSLDAIGPSRSFALLDRLRVDLEEGRGRTDFSVAGFEGICVATLGAGSRGLWAVARSAGITAPEREVANRFCRSFGLAVHQLDGTASPATTLAVPVEVEAHRARDSVLAEVQVRLGDQIRPGHGRAATRVEAITRAVLVAAGRHVTFRYASEVAHEREHAAVVLLEGVDHSVSLGSALSPHPGGVATAQAAIRALDGLAA